MKYKGGSSAFKGSSLKYKESATRFARKVRSCRSVRPIETLSEIAESSLGRALQNISLSLSIVNNTGLSSMFLFDRNLSKPFRQR